MRTVLRERPAGRRLRVFYVLRLREPISGSARTLKRADRNTLILFAHAFAGRLLSFSLMPKNSAGILMYRYGDGALQLLLVHPGGPFWARKDIGAWSIPKGEFEVGEEPLAAARREFLEETGFTANGEFHSLGAIRQPSGKVVYAWAVPGTCDTASVHSNTFTMEWPPKSGHQREFPEVDRAEWFSVADAKAKLVPGQVAFVESLCLALGIE